MAYLILGGLGWLIGAMMYRFSGSFYGLALGMNKEEHGWGDRRMFHTIGGGSLRFAS